MLERNQRSLQSQSDPDWVQSLIVDPVGLGVGASYDRLAHHEPQGDWVWILDDDDECAWRPLVADVRRIAAQYPEVQVVMVRMDHGVELGILPDTQVWGEQPLLGHLGVSSYIVRADVWKRHARAFSPGRYASDFDFIADVWQEKPTVYWHDVVASRCQNGRSMGAPEIEFATVEPQERAVVR